MTGWRGEAKKQLSWRRGEGGEATRRGKDMEGKRRMCSGKDKNGR